MDRHNSPKQCRFCQQLSDQHDFHRMDDTVDIHDMLGAEGDLAVHMSSSRLGHQGDVRECRLVQSGVRRAAESLSARAEDPSAHQPVPVGRHGDADVRRDESADSKFANEF